VHIPLKLRGGRFKAPIGLEGFTSGANTTFLERGLTSIFFPTRNSGLLLHGDTPLLPFDIRWAVGLVQEESELDVSLGSKASVTSRFAMAFRPGNTGVLIHAGVNYLHRVAEDSVFYLERPESHIAPQFVDTGDISANSADSMILEGAMVKGPLSFQMEYATAKVNATDQASPRFHAFYTMVSYFLTGETRPYIGSEGRFGPVRPLREFRDGGGRIRCPGGRIPILRRGSQRQADTGRGVARYDGSGELVSDAELSRHVQRGPVQRGPGRPQCAARLRTDHG